MIKKVYFFKHFIINPISTAIGRCERDEGRLVQALKRASLDLKNSEQEMQKHSKSTLLHPENFSLDIGLETPKYPDPLVGKRLMLKGVLKGVEY